MGLIIVGFIFGVVFIIVVLVLTFKVRELTVLQQQVLKTVLALAVAGVAGALSGFIAIQFNFGVGVDSGVTAGGALAAFVLVYLINPRRVPSVGLQLSTREKVIVSAHLKLVKGEIPRRQAQYLSEAFEDFNIENLELIDLYNKLLL